MPSNSRIVICLCLLGCAWPADTSLSFSGTTDRSPPFYQRGEHIVFSVQLLDHGKPLGGRRLAWTRRGDDAQTANGEGVSSATEALHIETTASAAGFVHLVVKVLDAGGKPAKGANWQDVQFEGGAGVEIDTLAGVPEPADFDAFWSRQKTQLAAVPATATVTEVPSTHAGYEAFDVRVDCAGGKPVSGYLTRPKGAAAGALPAQLNCKSYGVGSASQDVVGETLVLCINAHGIENGREPAYYKQLQDGPLKDYAFNAVQNADPETAYLRGMMLRVLRALEFLKSRPEWNGTDLTTSGYSQGGLQAVVGAALDPAVTRCLAHKPWCCDLAGITLGRLRGFRPDWGPALGYFDAANHGRRVRCPTALGAGLGDYICPPSGLAILYNNLPGPKRIEFVQGSTHVYDPPNPGRFPLKRDWPRQP